VVEVAHRAGIAFKTAQLRLLGGFEGMNAPTPTVLWVGGLRGRQAPIRKA
jgi:hypothetical protein